MVIERELGDVITLNLSVHQGLVPAPNRREWSAQTALDQYYLRFHEWEQSRRATGKVQREGR